MHSVKEWLVNATNKEWAIKIVTCQQTYSPMCKWPMQCVICCLQTNTITKEGNGTCQNLENGWQQLSSISNVSMYVSSTVMKINVNWCIIYIYNVLWYRRSMHCDVNNFVYAYVHMFCKRIPFKINLEYPLRELVIGNYCWCFIFSL